MTEAGLGLGPAVGVGASASAGGGLRRRTCCDLALQTFLGAVASARDRTATTTVLELSAVDGGHARRETRC